MGIRTLGLVLALLALPGLAQGASDPVGYASATNACQVLVFSPVPPPSACPHAAEAGTATADHCYDGPAGSRCIVHVEGHAQAHGLLPNGPRTLVLEAQVADRSAPAARACSLLGHNVDLACEGATDLDLAVPDGGCAEFQVRAILDDAGAGSNFFYHLTAGYSLRACRDAGNVARVERA
jgi:hypothetical protein